MREWELSIEVFPLVPGVRPELVRIPFRAKTTKTA
jgi:hypothetical protein